MARMTPIALALLIAAVIAGPAQALDGRITVLSVPDNPKDAVSPRWTPTPDQADEALSALIRHLDTVETAAGVSGYNREAQMAVRKRFADYRFQAFGVTLRPRNIPELTGPTRMVELNAACGSQPGYRDPGWKQQPLVVFDGGNCYFRAFYDIAARRVAWVSVNGF